MLKKYVSFFLFLFLSISAPAWSDSPLDSLEARFVGPAGNRVIAVTGVSGNANLLFAGAASGGIWKSTDGGHAWDPVFDDQPASSIGSLAAAPSDPNVIWAGTGETFIRANISIGNGIYRSTDGGETWQHKGLDATGRIGRVIIHPQNPDIVYAAALGHCYGPQAERGVYRTLDGGETWQQVLFVDENTGVSDMVMDPNNPRILFAGTWEMEVNTWSRKSGGPGSGIWRSADGGETWNRLGPVDEGSDGQDGDWGEGLPDGPWGKIGLTMSADDSRRVYALIETSSNRDFAPSDPFQGVLWRSDDAGKNWKVISYDNNLVQRPLYYSRALASPDDADEIHFMAVRHSRSIDGGKSTENVGSGYDHHDLWIDPLNPDRIIVGHDGGVSISTDRGEHWYRPQLPIAQMYHVATDDRIPYFLYGNRQDGPSTRGPSNDLSGGTIPIGAWRSVGGCETGFALPSPADPDLVWTGCYDGILELHNLANGQSRDISVWPFAAESWPGIDLRYRFQWTFPVAISPHDPHRIWAGSQFVHETTDGGQSWREISPDLTTNDPDLQQRTGGLTLDDAGPTLAPSLFALTGSKLEEGLLWAGTNDGQVQLTRDGGESWNNVTEALHSADQNLPRLGTISNIEPSAHTEGTAYVTVDAHQLGDNQTWVFKTTDYGATWNSLRGDLPQDTYSYAHCVREDPEKPGLLYLGTENAVWISLDDGAHWQKFEGLPSTPVHWLEIQERFGDLVIATYGRGFWIVDDITPLRQWDGATLAEAPSEPILFAPREAWRFRGRAEPMEQPNDPVVGKNPEYGATLHYYLPENEEIEAELVILDGEDQIVRELDDIASKPGLHRVVWNLRGERTTEVKLRTRPAENPELPLPEKGWRALRDGGRLSRLMPPGIYTVRLTIRQGEEESTLVQPLVVQKDPHSEGLETDIAAQHRLLVPLWTMLDDTAKMINEIEWLRRQILDLDKRTRALSEELSEEEEAALTAAQDFEESLAALEGELFDLRLTDARQDSLRWKRLLYAQISNLAWRVGNSDFAPTDQQVDLFTLLKEQFDAVNERYEALHGEGLDALNERLNEQGLLGVLTLR